MTQAEYGLKQWLDKGCPGEMDYMVKHGTPAYPLGGTHLRHAAGDLGTHELYACVGRRLGDDLQWQKAFVPLALGRLPQRVACAFACMNMCNGISESR